MAQPGHQVGPLDDITDEDEKGIEDLMARAVKAVDVSEMLKVLTEGFSRKEQIAFYLGLRTGNHSAAAKVLQTFPMSKDAEKLVRELDPFLDF